VDRETERLRKVVSQMLKPLRDIPLDIVVESICGHRILQYDGEEREELIKAVDLAGQEINRVGVKAKRPNEVGNYLEPFVRDALKQVGFDADVPRTVSGRRKAAGYPDIEATLGGKAFYIEVKSYNPENADTTQRSFFLSPSKDFKVTRDAYHLIFAFAMEQVGQGVFKTHTCKVLDAKNLLCDVKYEFNSDNRRLYGQAEDLLLFERTFRL